MEWIKVLVLVISVICFLLGGLQFYRLKKDFQQVDGEQVITREISGKWIRRLNRVMALTILLTILSIAATILQYLE